MNNDTIDEAIVEYDPKYIIAMFSGGHDSLVATHIASQHPRFSFALHINTGIGIEQTRQFVRDTCGEWKIELREYKASENTFADGSPDPQVYEELVKEYGFPGAAQHPIMYSKLKERPLRMAIRDLDKKRGDKIMLVTGVRKQESQRRMRHVNKIQKDGSRLWVAPCYDMAKRDINDYIEKHELKRNPVVDMLHMSGECLCGAYAHENELEEIRFWFPEKAKELDELSDKVNEAGFPWRWGQKIPSWYKKWKDGQTFLPFIDTNMMMCQGCELRR